MFYKIGKITSDYKKYILRMEKLVNININNKNGI